MPRHPRYSRVPYISLAGGRVPVYLVQMDDHGGYETKPRERITVSPQADSAMFTTLLHESLHAISERHGLGLTERTIRTLEVEIAAFIARNPKIVRGLERNHKP